MVPPRIAPRAAAGARPESARWEIGAEAGQIELRLCDTGHGESFVGSSSWLTSTTTVDIRSTAVGAPDASANWSTEWSLALDARNPSALEAELDPGLELIDVKGPAVRGYRTERRGSATHADIDLEGGEKAQTSIQFLAHVRVPTEGRWPIPAVRPSGATWIGGSTSVILDDFHVLAECVETNGRRVAPAVTSAGPANRLDFEAESPGSVAELVFRQSHAGSACTVRGQLVLESGPAKLECALDWLFDQKPAAELEVDLSPGWLPDYVRLRGRNEPLAWHPRALSSGATGISVALPASVFAQKDLALELGASSTAHRGIGPLDLPSVRPVDARIVDDAWVAWVDDRTMVRPIAAQGLAWIDPVEVPGLASSQGARDDLREGLAWRWNTDHASARIDRQRIEQEPSALIRAVARVDATGRRITVVGRLTVKAGGENLESVPVWIDQPGDQPAIYRFRDESAGLAASSPLSPARRMSLGLPRNGLALELLVKVAAQTERTIEFSGDFPSKSPDSIPLVTLPRKYLPRGMIQIETPPAMRSWVKTEGVRRLDATAVGHERLELAKGIAGTSRDERSWARDGTFYAFSYSEPAGKIELFTERLEPVRSAGVIREAFLTTAIDPADAALSRLRLLIAVGEQHSLELALPRGASLVRIQRDGADAEVVKAPGHVSIPLTGSSQPARWSTTIVVDYTVARRIG